MPDLKASGPLLQQLASTLEKDAEQRAELIGSVKVRAGSCATVCCFGRTSSAPLELPATALPPCSLPPLS